MTATDVEVVNGTGLDGDFCLTCGKRLKYGGRGRHPEYCDEHRPSSKRNSGGGGRGGSTVKAGAASGVVSKLLIIATALMAHRQLSRYKLVNEALEDELTMSDDEADAIASPIARWGVKSKVGGQVLGPLVENEDLIDAGVALWEYNRRVSTIVKEIRRQMSNVPNQPSTAPTVVRANGARVHPDINGDGLPVVGRSLI
jgi:hypothetical protein